MSESVLCTEESILCTEPALCRTSRGALRLADEPVNLAPLTSVTNRPVVKVTVIHMSNGSSI